MECKGPCELEAAHRAGDKAAEIIERVASAQIDNLRSVNNLLVHSLGELLVALGRTETASMSIQDLLVEASEATRALKGEKSPS